MDPWEEELRFHTEEEVHLELHGPPDEDADDYAQETRTEDKDECLVKVEKSNTDLSEANGA